MKLGLLVFGVLSALGLTGCASLGTGRLAAGAEYAALGSSFAAGPGLGQIKPDAPQRCQQSRLSYPTLLAERLRLALTDASCGGATTAHILGPWDELPAQMNAVTARTRLITITIGGNDIGYVRNLIAASCDPAVGLVYQGQRRDCLSANLPTAADYSKLERGLAEVAQALRAKAPDARIIFVQYLRLLDDGNCAQTALSADETITMRHIGERLATITTRVADRTGAEVLAADQLSRGHTVCDTVPYSVGADGNAADNPGAPWHPNAAGMRAIADALAARIES